MKRFRQKLAVLLALVMVSVTVFGAGPVTLAAGADDKSAGEAVNKASAATAGNAAKQTPLKANAKRTILLYGLGSDLESSWGSLTYSLVGCMNASFPSDVSFLVMTGGSSEFHTEAEYLEGATEISDTQNQIWQLYGKGAGEEHGKMKLLDQRAISSVADKSMTDPATLAAFLSFAKNSYPADRVDLILWDHGGGPNEGFGSDERFFDDSPMTVPQFTSTIKNSGIHFDFIDFDACLMGSVEIACALADYADYLILSPETESSDSQEYTTWLNALADEPDMNGFALGRIIVDAFYDYYSKKESDGYGPKATLAVIDTKNFKNRLAGKIAEICEMMTLEGDDHGDLNNQINFYDEFLSSQFAIQFGEDGLVDFGNMVNNLGICITEYDNCSDAQNALDENRYTDLSLEIEKILSDEDNSGDDVLYFRSTQNMNQDRSFNRIRNEDKSIWEAEATSPTGFSVFFNVRSFSSIVKYSDMIDELLAMHGKSEPVYRALEQLKRNALWYTAIFASGSAVSELGASGKKHITYANVMKYWKETPGIDAKTYKSYEESGLLDFVLNLGVPTFWDAGIEKIITTLAEVSSLSQGEIDDWLADIVAQQGRETVNASKVTASAVESTDPKSAAPGSYEIRVGHSSLKVLDPSVPVSAVRTMTVAAEDSDSGQLEIPYTVASGTIDLDSDALEVYRKGGNLGRALYSSTSPQFLLQDPGNTVTQLKDAAGNTTVCALARNDYNSDYASIDVIITIADDDAEDNSVPGSLNVYRTDSGQWRITSFVVNGAQVPWSDPDLAGATLTPYRNISFLGMDMPSSYGNELTLSASAKNDYGISVEETTADKCPEVISVETEYLMTDIYGHASDITERIDTAQKDFAAGKYLKNFEKCKIRFNDLFYNGSVQTPKATVRYGKKTLKEFRDYALIPMSGKGPGSGLAYIYGLGDYCGVTLDFFYIYPSSGKYEYSWIMTDSTTSFVSPKSKSVKSVSIPSKITMDGTKYKVTAIKANACSGCSKLRSVTVGDNVKKIGAKAFYNTKNCKKFTLNGNRLKSVGANAFSGIGKNCVITIRAKNRSTFNKAKKLIRKAGAKKASFKYKKG